MMYTGTGIQATLPMATGSSSPVFECLMKLREETLACLDSMLSLLSDMQRKLPLSVRTSLAHAPRMRQRYRARQLRDDAVAVARLVIHGFPRVEGGNDGLLDKTIEEEVVAEGDDDAVNDSFEHASQDDDAPLLARETNADRLYVRFTFPPGVSLADATPLAAALVSLLAKHQRLSPADAYHALTRTKHYNPLTHRWKRVVDPNTSCVLRDHYRRLLRELGHTFFVTYEAV